MCTLSAGGCSNDRSVFVVYQFSPHYAMVKDDGSGRIESVMSGDVEPAPAPPENLSDKEKKRVQKEAKAREKKEAVETKRRLKQQEKQIKEEAKKKTETPAEKRRRRRREQERNSGIASGSGGKGVMSFLSPKRPGVQPKNVKRCRVHLLDGTDYEFDIEVRKCHVLLA